MILTSTLCPFPLILGATVFHFAKLYYAIIGGSVAEWFISALDSQSGRSQVQVSGHLLDLFLVVTQVQILSHGC